MSVHAPLLFLNFIDPSREARRAFRKRIRSHVAKDHYREAARITERQLSSHEKILVFSEPNTEVQDNVRPQCSHPLKCEPSPGSRFLALGKPWIDAMEDDFLQL